MSIIRVDIRKTDNEWILIENLIKKKYAERNLSIANKGYHEFLRAETNKLFQSIEIADCMEIKSSRTKKSFELRFSVQTENKIRCMANQLGIEPGELITRMILDPLLL